MKKLLSVILVLNFMFLFGVVEVSAESPDIFTYTVSTDGVIITNCNKSASGYITIPSTLDGYPVTGIEMYAFAGCNGITGITIPNSITNIEEDTFAFCVNIKSVILPDRLKCILGGAFIGCSSLTDITIPDSVTSIDSSAFSYCKSLEEITIPNSVTSMGDEVFKNCVSLMDITLPDKLESIGDRAFEGCINLTDVTIPDSVTSIGICAFEDCTNLTQITIPNKVISIGRSAFEDCVSLSDITIPDSVTSIGDYAFYDCNSLIRAAIGSGTTSIGERVFDNCVSLKNITVNNDNNTYCDVDGNLFTKDMTELIKYAVCKTNTQYSIPAGVTSIGSRAFEGCVNLTDITIPDSVTSIEDYVFYLCDSLKSITVDKDNSAYCDIDGILFTKDMTELIRYASGKTNTEYSIPDGVTTIEEYAFSGCESLTDITIPDSTEIIRDYAFDNCNSLTDIKVDEKNDNFCDVDGNLFTKHKSVLMLYAKGKENTEYVIPYTVTQIKERAFADSKNLTKVVIPDGVSRIKDSTFSGCVSLREITIPDSVTGIQDYAFYNCVSLTSIVIPNGVGYISRSIFENCSNLSSIYLGDVINIKNYAFYGCSNLKTVYCKLNQEDFARINIEDGNEALENANIIYSSKLVRFTGDYMDDRIIKENETELPIPPEGYEYVFTVNGQPWDGKNITESVTVQCTQVPLAKITVSDKYYNDGKYYVNVSVNSYPDSGKLMMAAYDIWGKMTAFSDSVEPGTWNYLPCDEYLHHVKVFLWKDFNTMIPLADMVKIYTFPVVWPK